MSHSDLQQQLKGILVSTLSIALPRTGASDAIKQNDCSEEHKMHVLEIRDSTILIVWFLMKSTANKKKSASTEDH